MCKINIETISIRDPLQRPSAANQSYPFVICRAGDAGDQVEDPGGGAADFSREQTQTRTVSNESEVETWGRCYEQLLNALCLTTAGPVDGFLLCHEPKGNEKTNVEITGEGLVAEYENSSKQRRHIFMRQLGNIKMFPGPDSDVS